MIKKCFSLAILIVFTISVISQVPTTRKGADPFKELQAAKEQAGKENKRILIIVGGDWCDWCGRLDNFINSDKELLAILKMNFVVIKVHSEKDLSPNGLFLAKFPAPTLFPFIYVLNAKGDLLESKKTDVLEKGESYDKAKVKEFLDYWAIRK